MFVLYSLFLFKPISRSVNCEFLIPLLVLRESGANSLGGMGVDNSGATTLSQPRFIVSFVGSTLLASLVANQQVIFAVIVNTC